MMKKNLIYAAAIVAAAMATTSCNHDKWHQGYDPTAEKANEYAANFQNLVLNGGTPDPSQTWSTAEACKVTITPAKTGVLRIYTVDPVADADAAYLAEANVTAGTAKTLTLSRPQNATQLYAAVFNAKGNVIDVLAFDASSNNITTAFYTSSTVRSASASRRTINSTHTFTSAPADGDFATTVPDDAYLASQYYNHNSTVANYYFDDTEYQEMNPWMGRAHYYVTGKHNFTFNNPGDGQEPVIFYILPDADVHFTATFNYQNATKPAMYVSAGAKVTFDADMSANVLIFNRGEVVVKGNCGPYASGVIYNQGTLKCEAGLHVYNADAEIINEGTINVTGGDVTVEGSGHIKNVSGGHFNVTNKTIVNSNTCTWQNDGDYHTGNFEYTAGSPNVINNCMLTVDDLFFIDLGDNAGDNGFKMDGGAGVKTENFLAQGPMYIWMGAQSVFQVNETATMDITKDVYGIYGPETGDNGYAVFHAKNVVMADPDKPNNFMANYFRYLVVAYDEYHFPQGYLDGTSDAAKANGGIGSCPHYHLGDNAIIDQTSNYGTEYSIASGTCNPGFNGGGGTRPVVKSWCYFAFEDLGSTGDIDFNDVVLRVSSADANGDCDVELCAVGGTLNSTVYCGTTKIGNEVHTYSGWTFGTNTMTANTTKDFQKIGTIRLSDYSVTAPADLPMAIQVQPEDGDTYTVTGPTSAGEYPFRVVVSGNDAGKWFWPREYVNIGDAYLRFAKWGTDRTTADDWYKYPVDKNVVKW